MHGSRRQASRIDLADPLNSCRLVRGQNRAGAQADRGGRFFLDAGGEHDLTRRPAPRRAPASASGTSASCQPPGAARRGCTFERPAPGPQSARGPQSAPGAPPAPRSCSSTRSALGAHNRNRVARPFGKSSAPKGMRCAKRAASLLRSPPCVFNCRLYRAAAATTARAAQPPNLSRRCRTPRPGRARRRRG